MTLQDFYNQVFVELLQRNTDFHIGQAQRKVINAAYKEGKSIRWVADTINEMNYNCQ